MKRISVTDKAVKSDETGRIVKSGKTAYKTVRVNRKDYDRLMKALDKVKQEGKSKLPVDIKNFSIGAVAGAGGAALLYLLTKASKKVSKSNNKK